ncbi:60S ribosomal protein L14 [Guillardia theta]|uniref:60S ribosomal protein L14 n=1 Tax=Guillardia theta TaxID=55529 RepID=Q9AW81_GUITH|nr:60S ribosomal protein L14 [Guillardia theta]CAC26988.1 60S ribosomal protein L14 [Guillardia theta]|mmetsp:Transcript_37429/g.117976  ORF Transcript_37429/g.117976 Transcript_37429/m.117976 type:complete len:119 (-) Transcript_37429:258-614(-)
MRRHNIEIGRFVKIRYGHQINSIGVIIDIIDNNRCLIDGYSGRQVINSNRIIPTYLKIQINRNIKSKKLNQILLNDSILLKVSKLKFMIINKINQEKDKFNDFEAFKFLIGKKFKSCK